MLCRVAMIHIIVKEILSLVMKRHQQCHRSLYKTCKRMAKINLTKLFNKCVAKPYAKRKEKKFENVYRDKIKTEYLFQEVATSDNIDVVPKNIKFIEFNDLNYPSLREQIVKSSKVYVNVAPEVSTTSYALEKCTTEYEIVKMSSGRYLNFGVEKSLHNYLRSYPNLNFNNSCLDLSVGLYVIKSTTERGIELPRYLILFGKIANILQQTTPNNTINTSFIIGIYDGSFPTPNVSNEILRPFVDEMKALTTKSPVEPFNGRKISRIGLHAFICDPIANSIFTCTSLPDSLYGCSKCRVKSELRVNGQQFNGNITSFPTSCKAENLRLDDDFKYCLDSDYHLDVPIALELNVGLVSQTSIDYKYTVCLGVMKKLVTLWTKGKLDYRINRINWLHMLAHLDKIARNSPDELQKSFNYSEDTETWDAYHWKLFLIYFGPIVLHNNLPWKYYIHFMYLHVAARIMTNQYKSRKHSALIVGCFLNSFTTEFASLYGKHYVDYNVHNLIHFEETISQLGSIESVGGFNYEDQYNFVHSLIQYNQNISIEEIAEQISYKNSCSITSSRSLLSILDKPYHIDPSRNLNFDNFVFNHRHPNNYILTKKGIFEINEIVTNCNDQILIVGRKYDSLKNVLSEYFAPFNEEKLVSVSLSNYVEIITLDEIITKLIKFETRSGLFMMPLIRTS